MNMDQRRWKLSDLKSYLTDRRSLLQGLGAAAVGLSFSSLLPGCRSDPNTSEEAKLSFYNWDTYVGETTLEDFQRAEDISVDLSIYATNDELFAKLQNGGGAYDVIVPSNDFVERMVKAKMLQPLDHAKIPNYRNIGEDYRNVPFDPGRRFSMPYTWLILGIGYRKSKVAGIPDSWKYLFDSDQYKGAIALVSESGDLMRVAAKYLGHSVNAMTPEVVAQVRTMLMQQRPNIKTFHEDNGQDLLVAGDIDLVMEYNGDIAQVMQHDPDIGFVVPKEGSQFNSDNLCIPANAPHPGNAHRFINYLLDAAVGKKITEAILFPTPNDAVRALMPESYRSNPAIFPPAAILKKSEYAAYDEVLQPLYNETVQQIIGS